MTDNIEKVVDAWVDAEIGGDSRFRNYVRQSLSTMLHEQVEKAILKYENAITWNTSCLNCAKLLDDNYTQFERIAALEAALEKEQKPC